MSTRQQVGVGCLMVVAGIVTAVLAVTLGGLGAWGGTTSYRVPLDDAAGLTSGARVSVRGVDVGTIDELTLEDGQAIVHFEVGSAVVVRQGASASVRSRSLLGEKYLALDPGSGDELPEGSELPVVGEQYEVDEMIAALTPVVEAIDPEGLRLAMDVLTEELERDPEIVRRMLADAEVAVHNARLASDELPLLTTELRTTLARARSSLDTLGARGTELKPILADADRVMERLDAASEPLPETVAEARLTLGEIRTLVAHLTAASEDAEALLARLEGLDRDTIHEILREEGVRVRLFSSGKRDR